MEQAVRNYIFRVMLVHLAFLALIVVVVVLAGQALYETAQSEAADAELARMSKPANLTSESLERYFAGIFGDLDIAAAPRTLPVTDNVDIRRSLPPRDRRRAAAGQNPAGDRQPRLTFIREAMQSQVVRLLTEQTRQRTVEVIWSQMRADVSDLLIVDLPAESSTDRPPRVVLQFGNQDERGVDVAPQYPPQLASLFATSTGTRSLLESSADWLDQIQRTGRPALSPVLEVVQPAGRSAILLAAVPISPDSLAGGPLRDSDWDNGGATRRVALGVIPLDHLRANYIASGEQSGELAMWLLDGEGLLLVGGGPLGQPAIAGSQRGDLPDDLSRFLKNIATGQTDARQRFEGYVALGNLDFDGVIALPRPVRILPNQVGSNLVEQTDAAAQLSPTRNRQPDFTDPESRTTKGDPTARLGERSPRLWLVALSNLQAVTRPIEQTTRTAVTWAAIVVLAMSTVLVSSAVQLIRGRNRLVHLQSEMVQREMREARQIQLQWLPEDEVHGGKTQNIDIAAENIPATHISGDFYNYFDLDDPDDPDTHARCALVIGDVTGHGTSAAFLMATTQMLVKTTLQRTGDPGRTLEEVNNVLASQSKGQQFVTILLAVLDPVTRELHISSAGHQAPLACRENETGQCQWQPLEVDPELVMGVMPDVEYPTHTVSLDGSRSLLMYTDGAVEVKSPEGQHLDEGPFARQLGEALAGQPTSAKQTVETAIGLVRGFAGSAPFEDDVTLLAVHLSPSPSTPDGREPDHAKQAERATQTEFSRV